VYVFEWGKRLINFNPQIKLGRQVSKVTVRGWDPRTKSPITYTAGPDDLPKAGGGGDSGPELAGKRLADKQDIVVNQPVATMQEARELALSLLRERAYSYLTGSGQVIGLPELLMPYHARTPGTAMRSQRRPSNRARSFMPTTHNTPSTASIV
jgi:hypothetical protein